MTHPNAHGTAYALGGVELGCDDAFLGDGLQNGALKQAGRRLAVSGERPISLTAGASQNINTHRVKSAYCIASPEHRASVDGQRHRRGNGDYGQNDDAQTLPMQHDHTP